MAGRVVGDGSKVGSQELLCTGMIRCVAPIREGFEDEEGGRGEKDDRYKDRAWLLL